MNSTHNKMHIPLVKLLSIHLWPTLLDVLQICEANVCRFIFFSKQKLQKYLSKCYIAPLSMVIKRVIQTIFGFTIQYTATANNLIN